MRSRPPGNPYSRITDGNYGILGLETELNILRDILINAHQSPRVPQRRSGQAKKAKKKCSCE